MFNIEYIKARCKYNLMCHIMYVITTLKTIRDYSICINFDSVKTHMLDKKL